MKKRKRTNRKSISNNNNVQKSTTLKKLPRQGIGTSGIAFYQQILNAIQPYELKWPQSMRTFEAMKNDDAIATVLNLYYSLVENSFSDYTIKYNKSSDKSKKAAEYLDYALNNMDMQTFERFIRNAATFKEKGFALTEKVYSRVQDGEYAGMWKISNLANRPQISLDASTPFEIAAGGRRIKSCRQDTQFFQNKFNNNLFINSKDIDGKGYKVIPRRKFILFGDSANDSNPFGNPIFRACYKAWKEKLLLEDLEINGASKDLAGIIELAIPQDILIKAQDPSTPEAAMVSGLMSDAANIHSGEQSYFIKPSDLQEGSSSVTEYAMNLLGIDGSGRQFSPSEMISQRRKAIFDIWGAGHTLTGEGSVSYNSAEVQSTIHLYHIKRDIKVIEEGINKDLIPQLLNDLNGMELSYKDIPTIEAGEVDKISLDEISKMVQRVKSVNGLVMSKDNVLAYHKKLGFDTDHMEGMSEEEIIKLLGTSDKGSSRAGESGGTSGTGDSQNVSGGDSNLENTA